MNNQHFETSKDSFNNHRIWIDVGAHMGQNTLQPARENPNIKVYAFEPNLKLAVQLFGVLPNYVVIPAAISTQDGFSDFYLNDDDATSSLKAFNPEGVSQWICGEQLKKNAVIIAPTVRLDTFLASMGIERVDYLKIDAQGSDFDVILSAGERIKDISKIKLEVAITPKQLYLNAHTRAEVIDYLSRYNFILVHREKQSFDQEENLTFIRRDILQNSSQLFQYRQLESLEIENILKVAEAIAITRSLEPYPKWHFNVEWNSPDLSTQLRRSIWEYFKTKQIEARIKLNWYHNLQLYLYLGTDLSSQLFIAGCYEPNEFYFLSQILEPGMTFLDIGANDGIYSLFASHYVGSEGLVLAFEPSPREFNRLQANLLLNKFENVKAFPVAVANFNGDAHLQIAESEHAGQNTLGHFIYEVITDQVEVVTVRCLDDFLSGHAISQVNVIKMDVEGTEFAVLEGARKLLQTCYPLLLLELSDAALQQQKSSSKQVLELLESFGYEIFMIAQLTGLPLKSQDYDQLSNNIVAAHPSRTWKLLTETEQMQTMRIELERSQAALRTTEIAVQTLQDELERSQAELENSQVEIQQVRAELENSQAELQNSQIYGQDRLTDLQQTRAAFDELLTDAHQVQADLQQTQAALQQTQTTLQQTQTELDQMRLQNQQLQSELERSHAKITAIETSKFWQLRTTWLQIKRRLGFLGKE